MLRFATGFQHCVKNVNDTWLAVAGIAITRINASTGKAIIVDSDNYLTCPLGNSTTDATAVSINWSPYLAANPGKVILGFRVKTKDKVPSGNLISFCPTATPNDYGFTLTWADLPEALRVANVEFYLELILNTATNQVVIKVNKAQVGTGTASAGMAAAAKSGALWTTLVLAGATATNTIAVKDFYVADDIAGDGIVDALGDMIAYLIEVDAVDSTNWAPSNSGGNATTILNAQSVPGTEGDLMSTKTAGATLEASLSIAGIPTDAVIHGICVTVTAKVDPASTTGKFSLKNGTTSTTETNFAPGATGMRYGQKVGAFGKQPDGSAWTLAAIDATKVVAKLG